MIYAETSKQWKLVWAEEFNKGLNKRYWTKCKKNGADWGNYMSDYKNCVVVKNGNLHLNGFVNEKNGKKLDPKGGKFITGGIWSKDKFSFKYGKVEIRAKFSSATGCWPALWMLGAKNKWPENGEIDLMEHLNFDNHVYQTVHSKFTLGKNAASGPPKSKTSPIKRDEYNTYGLIWDKNNVTLTVNGKNTFTYPRKPELGKEQFPFEQPFYFVLSMQIEGSWVGKATKPEQYPSTMQVDYIRVYKTKK